MSGNTVVHSGRLRGLNQAVQGYEEFRITNAVATFHTVQGANTPGSVKLTSTPDLGDVIPFPTSPEQEFVNTIGNGTFGALGRSTPLKHVMDIDHSWKKSSVALTRTLGSTTVSVNSLNDLAVGALSLIVLSTNQNASVGYLTVDFRIEVRGPRISALAA